MEVSALTVTVPPRPDTGNDPDLEQRVRELETLIKEARRRARRRRGVYAATAFAAIAAGLAVPVGTGGGGERVSPGTPAAKGSPRSSAAPRGAALAPPICSSAGSAVVTTAWLPGHRLLFVQRAGTDDVEYTRWCGPAAILARLHGATYRIRGGRCDLTAGYLVRVGLLAANAARGAWLGIFLHDARAQHHPGTFRLAETAAATNYASVELGNRNVRLISRGTVTIGRSMRDGTFALRLIDGTPLTGSWTCG